MMKIDSFETYLRDHGISPSYQRKRICEYIYENPSHPTVSQIYEALATEIPTLSKTTVYNTLKLFEDKKIASTINIDGVETRYEIYTPTTHGHFKCKLCDKVYDITLNPSEFNLPSLANFDIHRSSFYFMGICPKCK